MSATRLVVACALCSIGVLGQVAEPAAPAGRERTGFKPLNAMTADERYQGEEGGLYGGGKNVPPESHLKAALAELKHVQPRNAAGEEALNGRIGLISISMSNATQEFSTFQRLAEANPQLSPWVKIVDCAQGGQAMAEWTDPAGRPWREALGRIDRAGLSPEQIQVAWIKLANKGPRGGLKEHGQKLEVDSQTVIQNAKAKFPNLRLVYLGSRIYAGYAQGSLNPEPYAYESAFVVRWLIQAQIAGRAELNYRAELGAVKAPLVLWGPYFWADGVRPRTGDRLVWQRDDFASDGVHPSQSGRDKVANMLLQFFLTDETARPWFKK